MTFSPLISGTLPHHGKYSSRNGRAITRGIAHHWAGTAGGDTRLTNPNIDVSTNYFIYSDGRIVGQVPEEYRAWTSGSWEADAGSITWETQNSAAGGDWPVSDAALNATIALLADIAKRYGWKQVVFGQQLRGHREFASTACPGPYLWARLPWIAQQANAKLNGGGGTTPSKPSTPSTSGKSIAQLATEVLAGVYGNGADRRAALGSQYDAVQAEVNRRLNGGAATPTSNITQLAQAVLRGEYGNGQERVRRLGAQYNAVQAEVNRLLAGGSPTSQPAPANNITQLAQAVLRGEYGNGQERVRRLGAQYNAVQAEVNRLLAGGAATPAGKSIDQLAREVIRGDWGNGADRKARLERAGYNYQAVQNRVNQLL